MVVFGVVVVLGSCLLPVCLFVVVVVVVVGCFAVMM